MVKVGSQPAAAGTKWVQSYDWLNRCSGRPEDELGSAEHRPDQALRKSISPEEHGVTQAASGYALQSQADDILRETLDCYDDGAIDESDLAAYGLVLSQFHHAVADRRAALGSGTAGLSRKRAG